MSGSKSETITILGIETSCDETAAAVVRRKSDTDGEILSNVIRSQLDVHAPYGGVVPEIAARAHVSHLDRLVETALEDAGVGFKDLDGIAATAGPGLIGGVLVGLVTAKAIASVQKLPLMAVNHLEGHALTARLTDGIDFPYLLLLVSGGHTQLLVIEGVGRYRRLGTTIDDALGEAFDKTAKLLGLGYPGGPAVESAAAKGDPDRFDFPRPLAGRDGCNFSFSGLKTAVRRTAEQLEPVSEKDVADICAAFQATVADVVIDRTLNAMAQFEKLIPAPPIRHLVVAGGVAANRALKLALEAACGDRGFTLVVPDPVLCTDNAAMIAWAGAERLARGISDPLDVEARARWPLDPSAEAAPGAGVKA